MKAYLERMVRSMAWADREIFHALRDCPAAQEQGLPLLAHLLAAEHIWLSRITGREASHPVWPVLDLASCECLEQENASRYQSLIENLSEAELDSPIHYRNTRNQEFTSRIVDILTHVVIHGAYHRGQIARVLGASAGSSVNTDFITFVAQRRAALNDSKERVVDAGRCMAIQCHVAIDCQKIFGAGCIAPVAERFDPEDSMSSRHHSDGLGARSARSWT